jgi:hypothetical protein
LNEKKGGVIVEGYDFINSTLTLPGSLNEND